ncbi:hypothetical protein N7453_011466 [Penicillium expansum]|nr:hypothetical protein N7453_011466 [Penicillium expansum]
MKYYHADLNNGSSQSRGLALVTPTGVPIPNIALGDSILAVGTFILAEAYFLQRTVLTDKTF